LPREIEKLEAERTTLAGKLEDPALYQKGSRAPDELREQMVALEKTIRERYARWEQLEKLRESLDV
jgi:ATP-binding cassette subfamily F protein uup